MLTVSTCRELTVHVHVHVCMSVLSGVAILLHVRYLQVLNTNRIAGNFSFFLGQSSQRENFKLGISHSKLVFVGIET